MGDRRMTAPSHFENLLRKLDTYVKKLVTPFIRLSERRKDPIDEWKQPKNHLTAKDALTWLQWGYNVGIVAQPKGLLFLDLDVDKGKTILPEEKVTELIELFDTFTVKTRNGGYQLYFENHGIENSCNLHHGEDRIGELRANRAYVAAVGCFVPKDAKATPDATGDYTVFRDVPLKVFYPDKIPQYIRIAKHKNPSKTEEKRARELADHLSAKTAAPNLPNEVRNQWGESLNDVIARGREFGRELKEFLQGADHTGDCASRSEADFRTVKILWKFGFDHIDIADILQQFRPYDKTERKDYLTRTITNAIEDAKARGWQRETPPNNTGLSLTQIETVTVRTLEEVILNCLFVLIRGIPRIGKTFWAVVQLLTYPHGNFVSHRHSILRHAIGIFRGLNSGRSAVLVIGKDACCPRKGTEKGRCELCEKRIKSGDDGVGITHKEYFHESATLLREKRVLTPEEIPSHLCPYHVLRFAEKRADFCFTVPYYLENEDVTVKIRKRSLTVFDEDPTIDYFYPKTLALAEYHRKHGEISGAKNLLCDYLPGLAALRDQIQSLHRKDQIDRVIVDLIDLVTGGISPLIEKLVNNPSDENKEQLITSLKELFSHPVPEGMQYRILRRVKRHLRSMQVGENISTLGDLFEPLLYPAQNSFIWLGRNPNTLYIVGDRRIIRKPSVDYLVVIGATNAEMFLEELSAGSPQDARIYDVTGFPYGENFIIFRLQRETKHEEDQMMNRAIRLLAENNREQDDPVPALILTSSKKNQQRLWDRITSVASMSRDDTEEDLIANFISGKMLAFYTKSTISRGIDVPYYDILFVHSCNFAQPYWESERQDAEENDDKDKEDRIRIILTRLIGDELTNSVLRHSPIRDVREEQVKVIVITSRDFDKIDAKVRDTMHVHDIGNDSDLKKMVAALSDFSTRPSKRAVRGKVGFNTIFPGPFQHVRTKLDLHLLNDTAFVSGKSHQEAKADIRTWVCSTPDSRTPDSGYPQRREKILGYPSLTKGCRAEKRAISNWVCKRYPGITRRTVSRDLSQMVGEGILRREKNARKRTVYSLRKEKRREQGKGQTNLPVPVQEEGAHA